MVCIILRIVLQCSLYGMRTTRELPDMIPWVIGKGGREQYMEALRSIRSLTTLEEFRKTHVLPPNLQVNLHEV